MQTANAIISSPGFIAYGAPKNKSRPFESGDILHFNNTTPLVKPPAILSKDRKH